MGDRDLALLREQLGGVHREGLREPLTLIFSLGAQRHWTQAEVFAAIRRAFPAAEGLRYWLNEAYGRSTPQASFSVPAESRTWEGIRRGRLFLTGPDGAKAEFPFRQHSAGAPVSLRFEWAGAEASDTSGIPGFQALTPAAQTQALAGRAWGLVSRAQELLATGGVQVVFLPSSDAVSYTHLTLPTN